MFSEKFSPLIDRFPQESDALRRIASHFEIIENRSGAKVFDMVFDPNRLFDISQAGSSARFAKVTTILIEARILDRKFVVRSPLGSAILELDSWYDLPDTIYDPLTDRELELSDDDVETMYSVVPDGVH